MLKIDEKSARVEEYLKNFYQSLNEMKCIINESEFSLCNIIVIVNEVSPEGTQMKKMVSSRNDDVSLIG
jgi:hypothetical protein